MYSFCIEQTKIHHIPISAEFNERFSVVDFIANVVKRLHYNVVDSLTPQVQCVTVTYGCYICRRPSPYYVRIATKEWCLCSTHKDEMVMAVCSYIPYVIMIRWYISPVIPDPARLIMMGPQLTCRYCEQHHVLYTVNQGVAVCKPCYKKATLLNLRSWYSRTYVYVYRMLNLPELRRFIVSILYELV